MSQITQYEEGRIVVGGGPHTAKSTFAASQGGRTIRHTDDLIDLGWSEASAAAADWLTLPGPWLVEGVATARALRKALDARMEAPCDLLIWLTHPFTDLSPGQASMAKGCQTVFDGIQAELIARGVRIEFEIRQS